MFTVIRNIQLSSLHIAPKVEQGHKSDTCIMEDYCDGEAFASHPIFSVHNDALQIFLYFDELEVANPIGTKSKTHKLGMF